MAQLQSTSITGSLIVTQGITGSFSGSITNAVSASYAATASYALNAGDSIWTGSSGNIYYSGGNVGIGITNPGYRLEVNGGTGAASGNIARFTLGGAGGGTRGLTMYSDGSQLKLQVTDNVGNYGTWAYLNLNPDGGNVGIGITNPGAELHIQGTSTEQVLISYDSTRRMIMGRTTGYGWISPYTNGVSYDNLVLVRDGGNVGIGTTNPTETLSISGTSTSGVGISLANGDGTGGRILADNSSLYFYSNSGTLVYSLKNSKIRLNDGNGGTIGVELGSGGSISQNGNGGGLTFSDTTAYLSNGLVVSAGNVGIGTTSPGYKLDVNGDTNITGNLYFNSNSTLQPARRYVSTANLSSAGYTVIGTVTGDALASSIRISLQGTTNSTVINVMADILVNHYQDILITSYAGMYTTLTLRVVSNNNEIYSIEATTDSAFACTTYIEIFPLNSETVVFGGSAQTGTSLTHPCVPGMNVSATGGTSGNLAVGGNVGIGTTSPGYKLEVGGTLGVSGNATFNGGNVYINSDYSYIGNNTTDLVSLSGGTVYLPGNGNVGIGTTSPGYKLDVVASSNSTYPFIVRNAGNAEIGGIYSTSAGAGQLYLFNASSAATAKISTIDASYFTGGNVGIGTTNPSTTLDVAGGIISTGTYQARMIGGAGGAYFGSMASIPVIFQVNQAEVGRFNESGNLGVGTSSPTSLLHVYNNADVWHTRIGGASGELRIGGQTASGAVIQAYTPAGSVRDLYIQRDGGNVGIGTSSPTATLQINGAGGDTAPTLRLISTASDTFNWASSTQHANLTAGETSIHLIGKANSQYNQAYFGYRHVSDGSSSNMVTIGMYASDYLLNILGNGNVGIGTTSPGYKLNVIGTLGVTGDTTIGGNIAGARTLNLISSDNAVTYDINFQQYGTSVFGRIRYEEAASDFQFYAKSDTDPNLTLQWGGNSYFQRGNVGIGTTSPAYKLDVNGTGRFSGRLYADSNVTLSGYIQPSSNVGYGVKSSNGTILQEWYDGAIYNYGTSYFNGNVGIGTTSPSAKLQTVSSGLGDGGGIRITNSGAGGDDYRIWPTATVNGEGAGKLIFTNNGGNVLTLTSGGNVGIGTTAPSQKFVVSNGSAEVFKVYSTGEIVAGTNYIYAAASGNSFYSEAAANFRGGIRNDIGAYLQIDGGSSGNTYFNGNVGIGTTTPSHNLHIYGAGDRLIKIENTGTYLMYAGLISNEGYIGSSNATPLGLYTNNVNRLYINTSGNVGIGTTSPGSKLHVNGAITVGASISSFVYGTLSYVDATDGVTLTAPGQNMTLVTGYNEKITIKSGQNGLQLQTNDGVGNYTDRFLINQTRSYFNTNVGIGTTAPASMLHIYGSGNTFTRYTNTTSAGHFIDIGANSAGESFVYGYGAYPVLFGTNNTERMRITSGGNVGIGINSPAELVDAYKSFNGDVVCQISNPNAGTSAAAQFFASNGTNRTQFFHTGTSYTGAGVLTSAAGLGGLYNATVQGLAFLAANASGTIKFATGTGNDERMRITGDGNVGIGTTNPSNGKLQVNGRIYTVGTAGTANAIFQGGQLEFYKDATPTYAASIGLSGPSSGGTNDIVFETYGGTWSERMRIATGGNVGIGTTSPTHKLQVAGPGTFASSTTSINGNVGLYLGIGGSTSNYNGILFQGVSTYDMYFGRAAGAGVDDLVINNGSSELVRFKSTGNVGIGTTSPGAKLEVAGTSLFSNEQSISYTNSIQSMYGGTGYSLFRMYGNSNGVEMQIDAHSHNSGAATVGTYSNSDVFIKTNQTNRMVVKGGGNVGIGVTNPGNLLTVGGNMRLVTGTLDGLFAYDAATGGAFIWSITRYTDINANDININARSGFAIRTGVESLTNSGHQFYVTSGGNVGIGVTAPAAKLQVSGSSNVLNVRGSGSAATSSIFSVDGTNGRLFEVSDDLSNSLFSVNTIAGLPVIEAFADYTVTMGTYGAYTLQVTGSRVGVGTSSPGYPLHVSGSVSGISIYATNDIAAFSDQSVKTDLQVIDSAVDRIKQINGYTYVRVDDLSNTRRAGVIAQEVQKVLPEVVSENTDGTLNVAYSNMIALLIEGMKEQQSQIDKLREDLEDLRYEL